MFPIRKVIQMLALGAVMAVAMCQSAFAAIDYSTLTDGLTGKFEAGVTQALPVVAVIIAAFLVLKTIRRVVKA